MDAWTFFFAFVAKFRHYTSNVVESFKKDVSHAYKTENFKQNFSLLIYPILVDELVPQSILPTVVCCVPGRPKIKN